MARTLKLVLAYDGTAFVGWQRQARGTSVQSLLEEALSRIEDRQVRVVGAGRTDAGVHALGQVASCRLGHPINPSDLRRALNAMLPPEVRVCEVEEVADDFHARFSAHRKTYRYALLQGDVVSPFLHRYAWHVGCPLDLSAMRDAARAIEGTHDFAVFQSTGSSVKTTVRTVVHSTATEASLEAAFGTTWLGHLPGPASRLVTYEIEGDGFLRHMVRAIVGSLVEVGAGRRDAGWFTDLIDSGHRDQAGRTAPAHGLWLVSVTY